MKCIYCFSRKTKGHFCSKMFVFKNIFKKFFIVILLDFKPTSELEFFQIAMRIIKEENLFEDSIDPTDIVLENLKFFIAKYDCF
jgi:hypothetical protein